MSRDEGYPPEYYRQIRADRLWAACVLGVLGGISLFFGYGTIVVGRSLILAASTSTAVFIVAALGYFAPLLGRHGPARIVPYFRTRERFGGQDTFFESGEALARNCTRLDRMALEAGLQPISAYGFKDNYGWGADESKTEWHDSQDGLRTVSGLLDVLARDPGRVDDAGQVAGDLKRIQLKLAEAVRRGVPFCFHVRMDTAYTGMEFDSRKGTYF